MAPSRSRATSGGVSGAVVSSCILFAAWAAFAQGSGSVERSTDDPVDPTPVVTPSSSEPIVEGHAAQEGDLDATTAAAFVAWTHAEAAAALRTAITTAEQDFLTRLTALQEQFDTTTNDVVALDLQHRIETLKFEHEVRLVTVQAEHARALGRTELAEEADRQVALMRAQYLEQHEGAVVPQTEGSQTGPGRE